MTNFLIKSSLAALAGLMLASCGSHEPAKLISILPAPASSQVISSAAGHHTDKHGMPSYTDNERTRYVRTTAYSHMENEPGAVGRLNAAGTVLKYSNNVRSAAADWSIYPLGTKFRIKGDPHLYVVDDYGSGLVGTNTVDIFHPTLFQMNYWGTRNVELTVVQWGCYHRSRNLLMRRTAYPHCNQMFGAINQKMHSGRYARLEANPDQLF